MAIFEQYATRSLDGKSATRVFKITDLAGDVDARDALLDSGSGGAPLTIDVDSVTTLYRVDTDCGVEELNDDEYVGTARYVALEGGGSPPVDTERFAFDTTGGRERIFASLTTIQSVAPAGESAPDHENALNVEDGVAQGLDLIVPTYRFSRTRIHSATALEAAYQATLFSLTGKVNDASWYGFDAGEILFEGAQGGNRDDGNAEITYYFAAKANRSSVTIGNLSAFTLVQGWDYVWVEFEDQEDATANRMVRTPRAAHLERIYERGDLSQLDLD